MSTIITRNSATSGSSPSSLVQGELAINVTDGRLFYGSGSGNIVKEFGTTASYAIQALSSSYAITASYALTSVTPSLQQVVNTGNSLVNFGGIGTASLLSVNFVNNRSLYLNDDSYPTIRLVDNNNASNNLQIDIDTISLDGVSYNWSDIVNSTASYALNALSASYAETASYAPAYLPLTGGTISGTLYQSGTFYPDQIDWFSSSIGYDTGSYILTTTTNGLTTYANYQDVASTLAPYIPTVSSSISASYAQTASYAPAYLPLTGGTIDGNVTINGTASIAFLNVTYESASVIYSSGSNQFGDASNDVQTLWGTVDIKSGPVLVTGSVIASSGFTGSLFGTASYATQALSSSYATTASYVQTSQTASYVLSASYASTASYVQNAQTASYVLQAISASYATTASYVQNAQSASYVLNAISASYVQNAQSASYVLNAVSASFATTASYYGGSVTSASFASTASFVNTLNQNVVITGSLSVTSSVYINNALYSNQTNTLATENKILYAIPTSTYDALFVEYVAKNGSNIRAGQIMSATDGTSVKYTETTTTDIGSTSPIIFNVSVAGGNIRLEASASTSTWTVKTITRTI